MPSAHAGLIVSHLTASRRADRESCLPPGAIAFAASWFSRWMPFGVVGVDDGAALAASTSAMFSRMPSNASSLNPPQSAHMLAQMPLAASRSRDLVGLDAVMERRDLVAELLRDVDHLRHLVGAVAVVVDEDVAAQHIGQRLQLEVAVGRFAGSDPRPSTRSHAVAVFVAAIHAAR